MNRRPAAVASMLLLLTFTVGGLAGMALEEGLGLDWFDFLDEDNRPVEGPLLSGLDLSDSQNDRIQAILKGQDDRLEQYWENRLPEMEEIVAESYDQIRPVLTTEQRTIFDQRVQAQGIRVLRDPD